MSYEVQQALNEIMDMPPMFRRDYMISYIRKHLPKDEAKTLHFKKDRKGYVERMIKEGYIAEKDLFETIGKERILQYFSFISKRS